jgi:hypothetical protein
MGRLGDIAEPEKVFERNPHIRRVSEPVGGKRHGPFVAKALAREVQMRYPDLLISRIAMRGAAEIESDEHYHLPPPCFAF